MAAFAQILAGVNAAGSALGDMVSLVNKWYPMSNRELSSVAQSIRFVNDQVWHFTQSTSVRVSDNGVDWETRWPGYFLGGITAGMPFLNDIAFGNGNYVIVGELLGGTAIILHSTDGQNWTRRPTTLTSGLTSIAWSPTLNLFVAVGGNGYTLYSSDGQNWNTGARNDTANFLKVEWGGDKFVAVNGTGNAIYRSTNGTTWQGVSPAAIQINDVTYSPTLGLWALCRITGGGTQIMTSPDAATWTARAVTGWTSAISSFGIHWNGTRFIATANGAGVATSENGINWAVSSVRPSQLGRMCTDTRTGVVIANTYSGVGSAISFDNGFNWGTNIEEQTSVGFIRTSESVQIVSTSYDAGKFWVTNTTGNLYYTEDNKVWFTAPIPSEMTGALRCVCNASAAAVPYLTAVGVLTSVGRILTSLDGGLTWTVRASGSVGTGFNSCASDGVTTVAVSNDGKILSTTDGITWTARTTNTTAVLRSVIYAAGKFVVVGSSYSAYSLDGITWTPTSTSYGTFVGARVVHDGSQFIATGSQSATINIKISADGTSWTTGPVMPWGNVAISSFVRTNQGYVAAVATSGIKVVYFGSSLSSMVPITLPGPVDLSTYIGLCTDMNRVLLIGTTLSALYVSDDAGQTWYSRRMQEPTNSTLGFTRPTLSYFEDNIWLFPNGLVGTASYGIYSMSDDSYIKYTVPYYPTAIAKFGNNYILGCGTGAAAGRIYTSPDKINWTLRNTLSSSLRGFAYNGTRIVAATDTGATASVSVIFSDDDGVTWLDASSSFNVMKVIWAADMFVAVVRASTNGTIRTSTDGFSWTSRRANASDRFVDVIYGNGLFVAISAGPFNKIYTSEDAITWTPRGLTTFNIAVNIVYVAPINTFFVSTTNGTIYRSTNGIDWTVETIANNAIVGMFYDGVSKVYAMSSRGTLFTYEHG